MRCSTPTSCRRTRRSSSTDRVATAGPPEPAGASGDADQRLPIATAGRGAAGEDDAGAERHGASREESLASTDFRDLDQADQVRDIEALMRRFARRLKHLQLRREARFHHGRRLDLQGTIRRSVGSGGTPFRLAWKDRRRVRPRLRAAAGRQPFDEPLQLLLPAPCARAVRASSPTCIASSSTPASPAWARRCATRTRGDRRNACTCLPPAGAAARASANACRISTATTAARLVHSRTGVIIVSDGYDTGEPELLAAGARHAATAVAAHRLAQPAAEPAGFQSARAAGCRRRCRTSTCFAPGADLASIERVLPQLIEALR